MEPVQPGHSLVDRIRSSKGIIQDDTRRVVRIGQQTIHNFTPGSTKMYLETWG